MGAKSKIEWTDATWNPVTGCTKCSEGCRNCYAEKMHNRLRAMGSPHYQHDFNNVVCYEEALKIPYRWKKPRKIFVNSMADLYHCDVPSDFEAKIIEVIENNPHHIFQILTKRPYRASQLHKYIYLPNNLWFGITLEYTTYNHTKIDNLYNVCAKHRFISFEPLIGYVGNIDLSMIDWVIIGGETGRNARYMSAEWVDNIVRQAQARNIPVFYKQRGSNPKNEPSQFENLKQLPKEMRSL